MRDDRTALDGIDRRGVLSGLGGVTATLVGFSGTVGASPSEEAGKPYRLVQGDRCVELTPLRGSESAAEFYDYGIGDTLYSSQATAHLQRPDTSQLFLYEAPDGTVSLVVIHGKFGGSHDGGAASLTFHNLPEDGAWQVQDDLYDAPTNYDVWQHGAVDVVDWTWGGGRTDGGVYGPLGGHFEIEIDPAFNEEAALYGEHYDGTVTEWQALSGDVENPDRIALDMDESIRLEVGPCEPIRNRPERPWESRGEDTDRDRGRGPRDDSDRGPHDDTGDDHRRGSDDEEGRREEPEDDGGEGSEDSDHDSDDAEAGEDGHGRGPPGRAGGPPGRGMPPWANGE